MALLLNIDTSAETGSVCLSKDGTPVKTLASECQRDHAAMTAGFIKQLLQEYGTDGGRPDAIALSAGPGSYTGLRVAASTAKGLCYAWNIPLIAIGTLKMMANGFLRHSPGIKGEPGALLTPVIDARRQEVFTAVYDTDLQEVQPPQALLLDDGSFKDVLQDRPVYFFGSGSQKLDAVLHHPHAHFGTYTPDAADLAPLAEEAFRSRQFADVAYFEPFYLKPFYSR